MTGSVAPAEDGAANGGGEGGAADGAGANGAAGAYVAANGHAEADAGGDVEAAVAEKPEFGPPQDMSYLQARLAACVCVAKSRRTVPHRPRA